MKAIQVRYLGPTNTKVDRFKAFTAGGYSITIPMDYSASCSENERWAALELMRRFWDINGVFDLGDVGYLANGDAVFIPCESEDY